MKRLASLVAALVVTVAGISASGTARADARELRIAQQFGIAYLPFVVMREHRLIEKHAAREGIPEVDVQWVRLGGGAAVNDALISGNLDFAAAGIPGFLTLWDKTKGNAEVRVAAGLNNIPVFLNTTNPKVKSIEDFTSDDKIALPAVKISLQALVLQMAAAQQWGAEEYDRLDKLTVSMKHPDGMIALLSGNGDITSHLTSPPFMFQELEDPRVRLVLSSSDVIGPHSFNVVYTSERFRKENPRLYRAYLAALDEAMDVINADKTAATRLYLQSAKMSDDKFESMHKIISDERVEFTTVPSGMIRFASFMHEIGSLRRKPQSWKELCFPEAAAKSGS